MIVGIPSRNALTIAFLDEAPYSWQVLRGKWPAPYRAVNASARRRAMLSSSPSRSAI